MADDPFDAAFQAALVPSTYMVAPAHVATTTTTSSACTFCEQPVRANEHDHTARACGCVEHAACTADYVAAAGARGCHVHTPASRRDASAALERLRGARAQVRRRAVRTRSSTASPHAATVSEEEAALYTLEPATASCAVDAPGCVGGACCAHAWPAFATASVDAAYTRRVHRTPTTHVAADCQRADALVRALAASRVPPARWAACGVDAGVLALTSAPLDVLAWTFVEHLIAAGVLPTWRSVRALGVRAADIGTQRLPVVALVDAYALTAGDVLALPGGDAIDALVARLDADACDALALTAPTLVALGATAAALDTDAHRAAVATWRSRLGLTPSLVDALLVGERDGARVDRIRAVYA